MEQIWNQVVERLSNPEVLFGLAVRFFGVFIVLIIVMIVLYLSGWVFQRLEKKAQETPSPAGPAPSPPASKPQETPTETIRTSPGSAVPDEVAIAIALAMVPDEVAVAVALALAEAVEERGSLCPFCLLVDPRPPRGNNREVRGSSWADSRVSSRRPLSHATSPQKANSRQEAATMKKYEYMINGKPFVVEILSFDGRRGDVRVNNVAYSVEVPQGPAAGAPVYATPSPAAPPPAAPPGPPAAAPASAPTPPPAAPVPAAAPPTQASSDSMVVAPMPGIILSIAVKEGDEVSAGDAILVLEAMKMENEIHAPRAGKVKKIHVSEGAEVQSGSQLIEFE